MFRLIYSNFSTRRMRTALTAAAIGLAVSLVVAVTSGYASVESAAMSYLNRYLGTDDLQINRPGSIADGPVPESLIVGLVNDPDVHRVTGRLETFSDLLDKNGRLVPFINFHIVGIRRPQDTRVVSLIMESGDWFDTASGNLAVVDQLAAQNLKVGIGDTFSMPSPIGPLVLKVAGIVHKPELMAMASMTVYVPLETLQHFLKLDLPPQVSTISIDLQQGASRTDFAQRWNQRLQTINDAALANGEGAGSPLRLRVAVQDRSNLDLNLRTVHILSFLGGAVSMMAATFIIFSSLAMGVNERQRVLAMLRAIGATRRQVAGMVMAEGCVIGLLGAAVGIPLGIIWTEFLVWLFPEVLSAGMTISVNGILIAAGGALAAALAASLLPALSASRLSPLEAMGNVAEVPRKGPPLGWAGLGVILILLDPLIFFGPWEKVFARAGVAAPDGAATLFRFYAHFAVGLEGIFIGFFLVAPLLVWMAERLFAPAIGKILGLPSTLLRQQLSSGMWRAAGAAAALMVGLAVLIVMTTQGISMLDGWKLPDKFPDIFLVSFRLGGLGPEQIQTLGETPGMRHFPDGKPELMPIAVAVSGLGNNPLALMGAILAPNVNSTMFFGFPPHVGLEMMELDFRDNEGHSVPHDQQAVYAKRAEEQLAMGRHVIVTEDYRRLHHAKYGDVISFYSGPTRYEYTICGICWSPGLDVIVAMFDLERQMDQRTVGMVFGSIDDARRDFGQDHVNLFAANLDIGEDKNALMEQIRRRQGDMTIKAGDVRQIKDSVDSTFRRLLALVTTVAFGAMAVASMGVTNTIMASIRSRRWQLGVLRAIGLRGGELMRLVFAEAILLGIVGLLLGLAAGAMLAVDARQLGAGVLGYLPALVIPWGYVGIGVGAVMVVSIAAAIGPAVSISRTDPLVLLQAGRAGG